MFLALLSAIGLSFSAGLNAYLPLLILALADRISDSFNLPGPYDFVSSNTGLVIILLVMAIELIGDKIPRVDRMNDLLHTPIRPLVGGFVAMAVAAESDALNVWLAGIIGLLVAGGVHYWKMTQRPLVTEATTGIGNPVISLIEDVVVIVVSIVAVTFPIACVVLVPAGAWWVMRAYRRMQTGQSSLMALLVPARKDAA